MLGYGKSTACDTKVVECPCIELLSLLLEEPAHPQRLGCNETRIGHDLKFVQSQLDSM